MLKIKIIVVDRTRSPFLKQGETFYLDRLQRYAHIEWVEVKPVAIKKGRPAKGIMAAEGDSIGKRIVPRDYIIALDRSGKSCDSEGLSDWINRLSITSHQPAFVIGGPLGLSKEILARAQKVFSLSQLTLTHEMTRLILLEQLYRAFTIINNEKYHK